MTADASKCIGKRMLSYGPGLLRALYALQSEIHRSGQTLEDPVWNAFVEVMFCAGQIDPDKTLRGE